MLCKIDNFVFEGKEIKSEDRGYNFSYSTLQRIANNPLYQANNEDNESITLTGIYIKEKMDKLEPLIQIAKNKTAVRYTTIKDSFLVIITSIKRTKTEFLDDVNIIQNFTISLKRYYK